MKTILKTIVAAVTVAGLAATPALAASKSYCQTYAKQAANKQVLGKTVVGAGLGCIVGQIFAKKCGAGALIGGGGGFLFSNAKWSQVYHANYKYCRNNL